MTYFLSRHKARGIMKSIIVLCIHIWARLIKIELPKDKTAYWFLLCEIKRVGILPKQIFFSNNFSSKWKRTLFRKWLRPWFLIRSRCEGPSDDLRNDHNLFTYPLYTWFQQLIFCCNRSCVQCVHSLWPLLPAGVRGGAEEKDEGSNRERGMRGPLLW